MRNLTEFGAFVEIEEGFDGLIHVSDISWTGRVKNPGDVFKKGDTVEAKVLKIDPANRRVSLGVKQLNDIWSNWFAAHKVNDVVRGKVSRLTTFGAFVELADGIEGLCHISEIEERRAAISRRRQPQGSKVTQSVLAPGREYDFKIVKINPDQHKIGLSYRAAVRQAERREMEDYRSSKSSSTATIGDAIMAKRRPCKLRANSGRALRFGLVATREPWHESSFPSGPIGDMQGPLTGGASVRDRRNWGRTRLWPCRSLSQ